MDRANAHIPNSRSTDQTRPLETATVDIRIGVTDTPREVQLKLDDDTDRAGLKASIEAALAGDASVLWLTDDKGLEVAVAAARISYVELGPEGNNPIGFG